MAVRKLAAVVFLIDGWDGERQQRSKGTDQEPCSSPSIHRLQFRGEAVFFDFHWITGVMFGFEAIDDPDCVIVVVDFGILRMMITKAR